MIEFKPFRPQDWIACADAERFPDGGEPLTACFDLQGFEGDDGAQAVLDAHGLWIFWGGMAEGPEMLTWEYPSAARAAVQLRAGMSVEALRALPGAT
jgi:hypothetical protein